MEEDVRDVYWLVTGVTPHQPRDAHHPSFGTLGTLEVFENNEEQWEMIPT